jgi:hypothetical protein
MTDDDILRMAIECQLVTTENREGFYSEALMRFARMAMQHEREACAKVCDEIGEESDAFTRDILRCTADAIRAKGEQHEQND